jgi:hypothetical protein
MPIYQPSPKIVSSLLRCESRSGLPVPISAVVMRILSQVEATIELTNRICDRYLPDRTGQPMKQVRTSAA